MFSTLRKVADRLIVVVDLTSVLALSLSSILKDLFGMPALIIRISDAFRVIPLMPCAPNLN